MIEEQRREGPLVCSQIALLPGKFFAPSNLEWV